VRTLPDLRSAIPDLETGRRLLSRIASTRDVPEPVAAWRAVPEDALRALDTAEKSVFIGALLPLARHGRKVERQALRRIYQLFAFMEMPEGERNELLIALHTRLRLAPDTLPVFQDLEVRRTLLIEAVGLAGRRPSRDAHEYLARLTIHLKLKASEERRWTVLFEHLTDTENRVAAILGKKGHLVRLSDRKLEIFKKAVAAVGVPAVLLFPLGTVGLSAEGIATGLVALGGGFLLPASIAMITGLSAAVAFSVSAKKILDLVLPTTDAERFSIDVERLNAGASEIEKILEVAAAKDADRRKVEDARAKIAEIIQKIVPLSAADRSRLNAAVEHARTLGDRYLEFLRKDHEVFEERNLLGADELVDLLVVDRPAVAMTSS
jgi:hypothetical protein